MLEITDPREGERGGQHGGDTRLATAAPHFDPAMPESRLGQIGSDRRTVVAEAATNSDPAVSGREGDHLASVSLMSGVAFATIPASAGAGESHSETVTHFGSAAPAKARKPRGKRSAVGRRSLGDQTPCADSASISEIGSDAEGESGHRSSGAQCTGAALATHIPGDGEDGVDHRAVDAQTSSVDPVIIEIREQWRRRQAWHRAEKSLTLQAKALCRRLAVDGDKDEADVIYRAAQGEGSHPMSDIAFSATFPLIEARDGVEKHRKLVEARLRRLAKQLPIAPWIEAIPGASLNTLAAIVGEAGDIGAFPYTNPAKLWKRMGLAVMPDGTRQQKRDGDGYSPGRRSVVWNIGGSLIGGMGRGPRLEPGQDVDEVEGLSDPQRIFVRRIRYEAERDSSHARPVTKAGKESFSKHAANRAKRYVEKRFLLLLWKEWRRANVDETSKPDLPAAEPIREAA